MKFMLFLVIALLQIILVSAVSAQSELPELPEIPLGLMSILAIAAPLVIQLINRMIVSKTARAVIAYVLSLTTGIIAAIMADLLDFSNPELGTITIFAVLGFTQLLFKLVWNPLVFAPDSFIANNFFVDADKK